MKKKQSLSKQAILYLSGDLILQTVSVVAGLVFARLLTPESYGVYSVYMAWVAIISAVLLLRSDGTLQIVMNSNEREWPCYVSSVTILGVLNSILIAALCIIVSQITQIDFFGIGTTLVPLLFIHSFGTAMLSFTSVKYAIQRKALKNFIFKVLISLSTVLLSIVLITRSGLQQSLSRILGAAIPYVAAGFILTAENILEGKGGLNKKYWKLCVGLSAPLILSAIASRIMVQCDRIMLQQLMGNETAGIYSFAGSITTVLSTIYTAVATAWSPEYNKALCSNNIEWVTEHARHYRNLITGVFCAFLFAYREPFYVVASPNYYPSVEIIPFYAIAIYLGFLYTFPVNYEFFKKKTKAIGLGNVFAGVINVILNAILIPHFSMLGAIFATCISHGCMLIVHDVFVRKYIGGYHFSIGFYCKGITLLITSVIASEVITLPALRWGIASVIGVILLCQIVERRAFI